MCTCPNNSATGWECCSEQSNCATDPCPCPDGYHVSALVACCTSVCGWLAGSGLMTPFPYIEGDRLAESLLSSMGEYLRNDIWTSSAPWLLFDPMGADVYRQSWNQSRFDVADAGLFYASQPVVYYDEITYPFKSTFWEHCTGLLQQVIWTMPMDRQTQKPKGIRSEYDPIKGQSGTPNMTYNEDFIQSLTTEAYKSSPVYWHYNIRHTPSQNEVCKCEKARPPINTTFAVGNNMAAVFGFSAMTLGGLGGADCYCGWWNTATLCRIPDTLCAALVQILGFSRICVDQKQIYNASDHMTVLASLEALLVQQPTTTYPCQALQISDHWGFMDPNNGMPWINTTNEVLTEGVTGFQMGNIDWLFASQTTNINPSTRVEYAETSSANLALQCNIANDPSIADRFIDELFPAPVVLHTIWNRISSSDGIQNSRAQRRCRTATGGRGQMEDQMPIQARRISYMQFFPYLQCNRRANEHISMSIHIVGYCISKDILLCNTWMSNCVVEHTL